MGVGKICAQNANFRILRRGNDARKQTQQRNNKSPINSAVEEQQKEDPNTTVVVVNNEASVDLGDATVLSIEDLDASAQEQTLPESTIACHHSQKRK